jgi:hypothetical protein
MNNYGEFPVSKIVAAMSCENIKSIVVDDFFSMWVFTEGGEKIKVLSEEEVRQELRSWIKDTLEDLIRSPDDDVDLYDEEWLVYTYGASAAELPGIISDIGVDQVTEDFMLYVIEADEIKDYLVHFIDGYYTEVCLNETEDGGEYYYLCQQDFHLDTNA